eukprot:scaffold152660_cov39-Prasinocladus_malaysianus.AAC.1
MPSLAYYICKFHHRVVPQAPIGVVAERPKKKKKRGRKGKNSMILPLPVAVAGGVLAGVFAFVWSRRPMYYEVVDGKILEALA